MFGYKPIFRKDGSVDWEAFFYIALKYALACWMLNEIKIKRIREKRRALGLPIKDEVTVDVKEFSPVVKGLRELEQAARAAKRAKREERERQQSSSSAANNNNNSNSSGSASSNRIDILKSLSEARPPGFVPSPIFTRIIQSFPIPDISDFTPGCILVPVAIVAIGSGCFPIPEDIGLVVLQFALRA